MQWFKGGITNICYNCLDRNVESGNADKIAIYWEGNEPDSQDSLTYSQLLHRVCQVLIFVHSFEFIWQYIYTISLIRDFDFYFYLL